MQLHSFFSHIHHSTKLHYFDGQQWCALSSKVHTEIHSPIDNSPIAVMGHNTKIEIDRCIESLKIGQKAWNAISLEERVVILLKAAELMRVHMDDLAYMQTLETGKLITASRKDIERSAELIEYMSRQLDVARSLHTIRGADMNESAKGKTAHVVREPMGIVLAISPFNYPINLSITKIAPALMMGNSVLFKGPTQGSISCAMLVEIFRAAGLPDGVIAYITGSGGEVGDLLVAHPGVNMVSFTGSTQVGQHIARISGCKPLQLELGGKDAALVLADADLDLAAREIVQGAFSYAGQRCTAIKRVLVDRVVHRALVDKIVDLVLKDYVYVGDPREVMTQLGPLISKKAAQYAIELLEDAQRSGAVFLTGGVVQGNFMEATVVDQVTPDMRLAWEEQFAPILPIIVCQDETEMIQLHNRSQYGLGASIFTSDMALADRIATQLDAGVIQINAKSERYPDHFPFLGIKDSGLGVQGIRWSLEAMSRIKSVVVNK